MDFARVMIEVERSLHTGAQKRIDNGMDWRF